MVLLPAVVKDDGSLAYVFLPFLPVSSFFFFFLILRAISFECHHHPKFNDCPRSGVFWISNKWVQEEFFFEFLHLSLLFEIFRVKQFVDLTNLNS